MGWSYSGNPADSTLDAVRFRIGDTDNSDQQLTDEEIGYLLGEYNDNVIRAAVEAVRGLISKYSRKFDQSVGQVKYSFGKRHDHFKDLLASLESLIASAPYSGGRTRSDKETDETDTDRVQPKFTRQTHDNRRNDTTNDCTRDSCC